MFQKEWFCITWGKKDNEAISRQGEFQTVVKSSFGKQKVCYLLKLPIHAPLVLQ